MADMEDSAQKDSKVAQTTAPDHTGQEQLPDSIEKLRKKLTDPAVESSLKGVNKTIQISLTDLNEEYLLTIVDGKLSAVERKSLPEATMKVTLSSSLLLSILSKTANATEEYMRGAIKFKGSMADLLRVRRLME